MTPGELLEKYWDADKHAWKWPLEDGFKDGQYSIADRIPPHAQLDRIGVVSDRTGDFMAVEGELISAALTG